MADEWDSIISDKSFQELDTKSKVTVAHNFFQANIASDKGFGGLPPEDQATVKRNFYATLQEKPSFEAQYPNVSAAIKTVTNTPRTLISGMTLGASEKVREKVLGNKDPEPYLDIPQTSRMAGEFAGAGLPISRIGSAITTGVKAAKGAMGAVGTNKFFDPAAKAVSWAVAGAGYSAAEKGIKKGELPTAGELGEDAAIWGGTEAIINSLGWGGRMAVAVNSLSKAYNVPRKDVLKMVFNQAKESGSPIVEIASQKEAAQQALKAIEEAKAKAETANPETPYGQVRDAAYKFVEKVNSLVNAQRTKGAQKGYEALRKDIYGKSIEREESQALDNANMGTVKKGQDKKVDVEIAEAEKEPLEDFELADKSIRGEPSASATDYTNLDPLDRVELARKQQNAAMPDELISEDVRDIGKRKPRPIYVAKDNESMGPYIPPGQKGLAQHGMGAIAGINVDEDGTIKYDPNLGMLGMAAGMVATRGRGKKAYADAKENPTDSDRVAGMFQRTEDAIKERHSWDTNRIKDFMVRAFVDVSGKAKSMVKAVDAKLGREIEMKKNAISGANAEAARQFDTWHGQIYRGLTGQEERVLDNVINAKRNIEISNYKPEIQHQEGLTADQFQSYLDDLNSGRNTEGLHPKQIAEIQRRADLYFTAQADNLNQMLHNGIINEEQFGSMAEHIYSPRQFLQHLDDLDKNISGRSLSVGDSGIKALSEGSIGLMEKRSQLLLRQSISRTQDVIARTKANNALLEMADTIPDNGVVKRAEISGYTEDGKPKYQVAGTGEGKISTIVDGEKVEMIVPAEFEKSWVRTDPLMNHSLAQALQWVSGAKVVKMIATGINPAFALTNMPRDIAMVWTGGQYSRTLPMAAAQFAKDYVSTLADAFMRKGRAIDYVKEGGGMELLTYYGKGGHMAAGLLDSLSSVTKIMGWIGETSEIWTRLAHRERALQNLTKDFKGKNGRLPTGEEQKALQFEATQISREGGIDFSQGGNVIKAIDNVIPYLNANIQGTRTMLRNAKNNPVTFTYQMAQLATVGVGIYEWNQHNPEAWRQIPDRDKEANFCIIVPDLIPGATSYTDDKGQKRYRYIKIPKDQAHRIFISPVEAAMEYANTGKLPSKQIFQAISDIGVNTNIPIFSALTALAGNVDDYQWEQIWKGAKDIDPKEEYRADTPKGYVKAGAITGQSPVRMEAALNKITPFSNPFIGATGEAIQLATGETGEELQRKGWNQFISENKALKRVLGSTSPSTAYREYKQEEHTKGVTENFKQNRTLDDLSDKFFRSKSQEDGKKIQQFIESQPEKDRDRLVKRYNTSYEMKDYPDRDFWRGIKGESPEVRAKVIFKRVMDSKPEDRQKIMSAADNINGMVTERVAEEFQRLMAESKPKKWKTIGE